MTDATREPDETGPIEDLRDNLTGRAAGDFAPDHSFASTQAPLDPDSSPLERRPDDEDADGDDGAGAAQPPA